MAGSEVQDSKAPDPMDLMLAGSERDGRLPHMAKADSPIEVS